MRTGKAKQVIRTEGAIKQICIQTNIKLPWSPEYAFVTRCENAKTSDLTNYGRSQKKISWRV